MQVLVIDELRARYRHWFHKPLVEIKTPKNHFDSDQNMLKQKAFKFIVNIKYIDLWFKKSSYYLKVKEYRLKMGQKQ